MYGQGVQKDLALAFSYYRLSAEQGYAPAQHGLGICYQNGYGTPKSPEQAFTCYKLCAEQGSAAGLNSLAFCYYYGFGVEQDNKLAFALYRQSADKGNSAAQNSLGICLRNGFGQLANASRASTQPNPQLLPATGSDHPALTGHDSTLKEAFKYFSMSAA